MAFLTQAMNQFTQAPILGQVDLVPTPNVIAAQIDPDSVATAIQNGSVVKQVGTAAATGLPIVDVVTGPTDGPVFGAIPYGDRKNIYVAGDIVQVCLDNSYLYMRASAAVTAGDKVTATAATTTTDPLVTTVSVPSTQYVTGVALTTVVAANDLVRIRILPSFNGTV